MRMLTRFACAVVLFSLHACGSTPTAPSPDFTGSWQGTYFLPSENPGTFTLELTQTGLSITGSALITQNQFAGVPATWSATLATADPSTTMQFVMSYSFGDPPCAGQFKGTLNVSTHAIDGPFTGQNCTRTFGGTLHAERGQ
jgi:hypothetical protein